MPAARCTLPAFSGEELTRLLALIKESDSVELKLTVPESDQRSTVVGLGVDPSKGVRRDQEPGDEFRAAPTSLPVMQVQARGGARMRA